MPNSFGRHAPDVPVSVAESVFPSNQVGRGG